MKSDLTIRADVHLPLIDEDSEPSVTAYFVTAADSPTGKAYGVLTIEGITFYFRGAAYASIADRALGDILQGFRSEARAELARGAKERATARAADAKRTGIR